MGIITLIWLSYIRFQRKISFTRTPRSSRDNVSPQQEKERHQRQVPLRLFEKRGLVSSTTEPHSRLPEGLTQVSFIRGNLKVKSVFLSRLLSLGELLPYPLFKWNAFLFISIMVLHPLLTDRAKTTQYQFHSWVPLTKGKVLSHGRYKNNQSRIDRPLL